MDSSPPGGSTVNSPQLLPPRKRYNFITPKDDNDGITGQSKQHKTHQSSSTPEENNESDSASRTIFAWKKLYEINILKGILEYYKENGSYPFDNNSDMQKFYKGWTEKQAVYVNEDAFYEKMVDLPERFFMNQQIIRFFSLANQTIEDWMDPMEVEIYRVSCNIWGKARDDDDDDGDDRKDSSLKGNPGGSSSS